MILYCLILIFLPFKFIFTGGKLVKPQYDTLKLIYDSTDGDNWSFKSGFKWNFSDSTSDPCSKEDPWEGITCIQINDTSFLQAIELDNYMLKGSLPTETFYNLTTISKLILSNNMIRGLIPDMSNLISLQMFNIDSNFFSNTIPLSIKSLTSLELLDFSNNSLSGTFPVSIGYLTKLTDLLMYLNFLNGTIPASIGNLRNLNFFHVSYNLLSGTIPACIGNLTNLELLYLHDNHLRGTIPESIGNLVNLKILILSDNYLSGSIPLTIGELKKLNSLYIVQNSLSGTIPATIGNLVSLEILVLSNNYLHSSIPIELCSLKNLRQIFLDQNKLSGSIVSLTSPRLELYELRSNELTGRIPSSLFTIKSLKTLSLSDNCLSTDFSHIIDCHLSSNIESLFLVGIGQNKRCKDHDAIKNMFYTNYRAPGCIIKIESLRQLYFSGNGLKGSLDGLNLPKITEFSISNNRIAGTLPDFFNNYRALQVFDIASNQIKGDLGVKISSDGDQGSTIKAEDNRLSGRLNMSSINSFEIISVLSKNLISCATVPSDDLDVDTYICETYDLKTAVITWCIVALCFILLGAARYNPWYSCRILKWLDSIQNLMYFHRTLSDDVKYSIPYSLKLIYALSKLVKLIFCLIITLLILTITLYCGFKLGDRSEEFKTHDEQYLYLVSGVYLRSAGPACALFILYLVSFSFTLYFGSRLLVLDWMTNSCISFIDNAPLETKKSKDVEPQTITLITRVIQIISCVYFIGVSLFVNLIYIKATRSFGKTNLVLAQIGFSIFNSFYQKFGIPLIVSYIFPMQYGHNAYSSIMFAILLLIIDVVNPCIATALTDDLCFKKMLFKESPLSINYQVQACGGIDPSNNSCSFNTTQEVSYEIFPPFVFSNQCRSSIFKIYIPTILYSCTYSTFLRPIIFLWFTSGVIGVKRSDQMRWWGYKPDKGVLNDVTYNLILILEDLLLLLVYGIVSPFCAVALWANAASRTLFLRFCIYQYYLLQVNSVSDFNLVPRDKYNIEIMCGNALKYIYIYIQPGIFTISVIFGLYLFEVAYDSDEPSVILSICLLVLTICISIFLQWLVLRKRRFHIDLLKKNTTVKEPLLPIKQSDAVGSTISYVQNLMT